MDLGLHFTGNGLEHCMNNPFHRSQVFNLVKPFALSFNHTNVLVGMPKTHGVPSSPKQNPRYEFKKHALLFQSNA